MGMSLSDRLPGELTTSNAAQALAVPCGVLLMTDGKVELGIAVLLAGLGYDSYDDYLPASGSPGK
jgi:predicted hotdog family 3-hydroxylacyl-ACP dehydratase